MQRFMNKTLLLFATFIVCACGRYAKPFTPEALAPRDVVTLQARATADAIVFNWKAPDSDARGKELKSMDGYNIYRKLIVKPMDITSDDEQEFELLNSVPDTHVLELKRLRDEAKAKGLPSHRVKVDDALMHFEYVDKNLSPGQSYLYKIVPVNQDGVNGVIKNMVRVVYRGQDSQISYVPYSTFAEDDFLGESYLGAH